MNLNILRPKDSEPDDRNTNPSEYIKIMNQKNIENRIIEPVLNNNIISNLKKESMENSFNHNYSIRNNNNNNLFSLQKPLFRNKSFIGFQRMNDNPLIYENNNSKYDNENLIFDYKTKFNRNNSMKVINNIPQINYNDNKMHYEPPLYNKYSRFGKREFQPKDQIS